MPLSNRKITIIVVEDNSGDFLLIEDFLNEHLQAVVTRAKTFREASQILSAGLVFDVILLDLTLPDCKGEELVTGVLKMAGNAALIVLTGYTDKKFSIKTLGLGASDYLFKDELDSSLLYKSISYSLERKRILTELKDSEEKYRNVFHASPLPMWVYDPETLLFMDVNDAACRHYGYSKEEFLKMSIKDIRPSQEVGRVLSMLEKHRVDRGNFEGLFNHLKKDGSLIHVNIQSNNIYFSGKKVRLVVSTDITEKIKAEKALRKQEALFRAIIEKGSDMKTLIKPDGTIIFGTPSITRILGFEPEDYLGHNERDMVHPDDAEELFRRIDETVKGEKPGHLELRVRCKNGEYRWCEETITNLLHDPDVNAIVCDFWDITEKKKAEKEKEKLIFELVQNNKDLRQFSYITSHNLRGPVANLLGLTNLLENYEVQNPTLQQILDGIRKATQRFDETIKDLTEVLNVKDHLSIPREELVLSNIFEKVREQCESAVADCKAEIITDFSKAPAINFNKAYLESIFLNLLTNSLKYRSSARKLKVTVVSERNSANETVLRFNDNGVGFNTTMHQEKLFRLYQRFHQNIEGKGLGLFLIKTQMEALKGSIEVESEEDKGTVFTLLFRQSPAITTS